MQKFIQKERNLILNGDYFDGLGGFIAGLTTKDWETIVVDRRRDRILREPRPRQGLGLEQPRVPRRRVLQRARRPLGPLGVDPRGRG